VFYLSLATNGLSRPNSRRPIDHPSGQIDDLKWANHGKLQPRQRGGSRLGRPRVDVGEPLAEASSKRDSVTQALLSSMKPQSVSLLSAGAGSNTRPGSAAPETAPNASRHSTMAPTLNLRCRELMVSPRLTCCANDTWIGQF
jgi:hypothetical protein